MYTCIYTWYISTYYIIYSNDFISMHTIKLLFLNTKLTQEISLSKLVFWKIALKDTCTFGRVHLPSKCMLQMTTCTYMYMFYIYI